MGVLQMLFVIMRSLLLSRAGLAAENLALRQQLAVLRRKAKRPKLTRRDRDGIYGQHFSRRVEAMGIEEVLIAPQSPWENPYVERLVGSIRRECVDHIIVLNEAHLRRILSEYFAYCHEDRTHLALGRHAPIPRPIQARNAGRVVAAPRVGGLHQRYSRAA